MTGGGHPPFLVVGHLSKAHGTKGELYIWPLTDYPESHFTPGAVHLPGDEDGENPSATLAALTIESVRPYRKGFLARFEGVNDRDAAEQLRGRYLLRPFDTIDELADDEIFYHELLGATVVTRDESALGTVKEVYPVRPSHLIEVTGPDGDILLPLSRRVVMEFDRERRRIVVDPPEGLLR